MLYGLLITLFILLCILLVIIILVQKSKGSIGIGSMGGSSQMIFGGSGGQDFFQRATWVLGALFMGGSLVLALMKSSSLTSSRYLSQAPVVAQQMPAEPAPMPMASPVQETPSTSPAPMPQEAKA